MTTLAFWKGAAERAAKSFAQALLSVIGVAGIGILDVNWGVALSVAGLAALASILTSIINPGPVPIGSTPDGRHAAGDGDDGDPIPGTTINGLGQ